ncbi:putative hydrolase [Phycisphaera mikurensis NBRC 102666]|uniref:Putative hydrolase n=2 Tax=Phycisphaera TaxID=666508 RepID=I0II97_PHYMF|nr:putative hydrolase [Phycisphaera mikurensis NBRC 102666]
MPPGGSWSLLAPTAGLAAIGAGLGFGAAWPRSNLFGGVVSRRPVPLPPLHAAALTLWWRPGRRGCGLLLDRLLDGDRPGRFRVCVFVDAADARADAHALEELADAGHAVGSRGGPIDRAALAEGYGGWRRRLDAADDAIADATGRRPVFFRPPRGVKTPAMLREAAAGGQVAVTWARRLPPRLPVAPAARWLAGAAAGGVLDLGADPLRAADGLPFLLSGLAVRGVRVVGMRELLGGEAA